MHFNWIFYFFCCHIRLYACWGFIFVYRWCYVNVNNQQIIISTWIYIMHCVTIRGMQSNWMRAWLRYYFVWYFIQPFGGEYLIINKFIQVQFYVINYLPPAMNCLNVPLNDGWFHVYILNWYVENYLQFPGTLGEWGGFTESSWPPI